jgi:short-subunit dehydrogenase
MSKTILIIGGSGNTGVKIAELLLITTDSPIVLAARNQERLDQTVEDLRHRTGSD